MKKLRWQLIPFVGFISLGFFLARGLYLEPQILPSVQIGKPLPNFSLPQLLKPEPFNPLIFKQKVVLFNVWASWCVACTQEQTLLLKLAAEGIDIYGLNYKDEPQAAQQWLNDWGNPYKMIASDRDGRVAIDLGVYGAPETFLIDKKGCIRYKHIGILTEAVWKNKILPLKKLLDAEA